MLSFGLHGLIKKFMTITKTPFRVSFFGGGTDYPLWYKENGGSVLSTSIDKYCYVSSRYLPPFFDHKSRVVWSKIELVKNFHEIQHPTVREALKFLGVKHGVEIYHNGDLPARSGLGSSSSFAVGLLHALYALIGKQVTHDKLFEDAIHLEQKILKENVGSQDQVVAACGGLNRIDFGPAGKILVKPLTISKERSKSLEDRLLIFFTGLARSASDVAAAQIQNTPKKEKELRAIHGFVGEAVKILKAGSLNDFGKLLHETWMLKRSLSSQITNPLIDEIYEKGRKAGALGGKLLGAGGGGFILFFAELDQHPKIKLALKDFLHVPIRFENGGSQIIYSSPEIKSSLVEV